MRWRIENTPDWAACRGVYFNMLQDRANALGPEVADRYRRAHPIARFNPVRMYPLRDYLVRIADVAELAYGDVNRGMFEIQAGVFPSFRQSILGRAWFAVFGLDLESILSQMCRTLPSVINCGTAELIRDQGDIIVRFRSQYVPIDTALAGAVMGVVRTCKRDLTLTVRLEDPFNGDVILSGK
jgi:uncharacterized protein (TIGR02265 family)